MAQRILVKVDCDLDAADDLRPGRTVQFWNSAGVPHELDLCEDHITELQDALDAIDGWAKRGRRSTVGPAAPKRSSSSSSNGSTGLDAKTVRAWAQAQGVEVSPRGRLTSSVIEQYRAANP